MGILGESIGKSLAQGDVAGIKFDGRWINWGDLQRLVSALDYALQQLGAGDGACVACALRNHPAHAAVLMGLVAGARCLVTLNALLPDEKLAADIRAARAPILIASREDWARQALSEAASEVGATGLCLTGDAACPVQWVNGRGVPTGGQQQPPLPGVAILMLTSGTTGAPKRVPLLRTVLQRQLVEAAGSQRHGEVQQAPSGSTPAIVHSSLVHIAGVWGVLGAALAGRPMVLMEKFSMTEWRSAVREHRPVTVGAPPAALRMILDANIPKEEIASLVSISAGTAPLDPNIVDEFIARYQLPVLTNYGATEFAGGVASWSLRAFQEHWSSKRGAVGRVHRGIEARVVGPETGEILPYGTEGILELKGFAVGEEGHWVRTTDRAVIDSDQFLWIRGRADNTIIRGGFKIQPEEVEATLQSHPSIREASVVGISDRRLGQVPVAALILKAGAAAPSSAELSELVRSRLMPYCVPTVFRFVAELPRTPAMKVSAPGVRELFEPGE